MIVVELCVWTSPSASKAFKIARIIPVAHTGIIRAILKAFDAEGDVQTQTLHDYQMYKGLVVREIELTGPETPHAYDRLQDCVANGMHTVRRLLNVLPPDVLFNKLTPTDYHLLYKANLAPTIYQDNMEKSNVAKITDTNPLMQYHVTSPLWQKYYDELGGRIRTKAPKDSDVDGDETGNGKLRTRLVVIFRFQRLDNEELVL